MATTFFNPEGALIRDLIVGPYKMTFGPIKGRKLRNVRTQTSFKPVNRLNCFVYCWLHAHAIFEKHDFLHFTKNRCHFKCSEDTLIEHKNRPTFQRQLRNHGTAGWQPASRSSWRISCLLLWFLWATQAQATGNN